MRYLTLILLVVSAQFAFVSCSNSQTSKQDENQEQVDYSEAFLLDVRTPQEHNDEAVDGSVNIPLNTLESKLDQLPKDDLIIVYCASGARAKSGIKLLESAGFTNLKNGVNTSYVSQLLNEK
ncbi:MAG: rhodanese-like domain-containing protein [Brumimicrobium sp.]